MEEVLKINVGCKHPQGNFTIKYMINSYRSLPGENFRWSYPICVPERDDLYSEKKILKHSCHSSDLPVLRQEVCRSSVGMVM